MWKQWEYASWSPVESDASLRKEVFAVCVEGLFISTSSPCFISQYKDEGKYIVFLTFFILSSLFWPIYRIMWSIWIWPGYSVGGSLYALFGLLQTDSIGRVMVSTLSRGNDATCVSFLISLLNSSAFCIRFQQTGTGWRRDVLFLWLGS